MSESESSTKSNGHTIASNHRKYGTIELFEAYWVLGLSASDVGEDTSTVPLNERGIPTRSPKDAQDLRHGNVDVTELWDEYLTEFQIHIAQELQYFNRQDQLMAIEGENL